MNLNLLYSFANRKITTKGIKHMANLKKPILYEKKYYMF